MKNILALFVTLSLLLAACTSPPETLQEATVSEVSAPSAQAPTDTEVLNPLPAPIRNESPGSQIFVVPIDPSQSTFEFEGYGPGKSHVGTFNLYEGSFNVRFGQIIGAQGKVDAASVDTGIGRLDTHLKSEDFFDVEQYPTIEFKDGVIENGVMTGKLLFRGVEKVISAPVQLSEGRLMSEFRLEVTPFNFKYTGIDKEVRLKFEMVS